MAGKLVFRTLPHAGSWTASDGTVYTDENEIAKPTKRLIRDASHAHAAGVIEVTEGLDLSSVQSQEDGEAEYAKAQEDGRWREGQEAQFQLEQQAREEGRYGVGADTEDGEA